MRRHVRTSAGAAIVAAAVGAAVLFSGSTPTPNEAADQELPSFPTEEPLAEDAASEPQKPSRAGWQVPRAPTADGPRHLMVRIEKAFSTRYGVFTPRTPLGSNRWLLVVSRHGPRAKVLLPGTPTGRTARVDLRNFKLRWTQMRVVIDQSEAALELWHGSRKLGRWTVAVGRTDAPTPNGRFSVTDRVVFPTGGAYGRFALGLSVHQPATPQEWSGSDQVAIHGTDDPSLLGQRVSLGCVRAPDAATFALRRWVPLGAPVVIHA